MVLWFACSPEVVVQCGLLPPRLGQWIRLAALIFNRPWRSRTVEQPRYTLPTIMINQHQPSLCCELAQPPKLTHEKVRTTTFGLSVDWTRGCPVFCRGFQRLCWAEPR